MSTLVEFVSATPSPLTVHLIPLAPIIHHIRHFVDVISWSAPWEESALLLALWWSFALFADLTLRFFLPFALLFVLSLHHWSSVAPPSPPSPPATEATVLALIDDLAAIHALLPTSSVPPPSLTLLRITAFLYPPYLAITYFVPLRISIAIAGTLFLVHRARWARNARAALARSAYLRWSLYALFSGTW